jgi:Leucine-rich repeat (LRR) protein
MSQSNSPFKFLDSYQQTEADVFFGREKETQDLYNALSGVKHLLVYGPSGSGKTSLVECGLRNQFSDADWFALTIRRGSDINASVFSALNDALVEKIETNPTTKMPVDKKIEFGNVIEDLFAERYQPVYLIFDQFEELLISGEEEEKKKFFKLLNKLIRNKVPCRVMLIMREEFIGHLSEFEPLCPSIFQYRFRVEKMGRKNVEKVIFKILEAKRYETFFKVENSRQLAESILSKLPDNRKEIELAHVQVFLDEIWGRAQEEKKNDQLPMLSTNLIKDTDKLEAVLESFLKKQIEELEIDYGKMIPLELLDAMISERFTKLQLSEVDIKGELEHRKIISKKPLNDLLKELKARRIIKEVNETQYEISHDVLAQVVGQNRTEEMKLREKAGDTYKFYIDRQGLLTQDDINHLMRFEKSLPYPIELQAKLKKSKNALKDQHDLELAKTRRRFFISSGLLVVALSGFIAAFIYWKKADSSLIEKNKALTRATKLISSFYFYDDKFALAINNEKKFFFMDTLGEKVEKLITWKKAEPFDFFGFARVVDWEEKKYLIDTIGNVFEAAYSPFDIDRNIKACDLSAQKIITIPNDLFAAKNLSILFLQNNEIHSIPANIEEFKDLIYLYLQSNQLESIPKNIAELQKLTILYLHRNKLNILPKEIGELINLSDLNLEGNQLNVLPKEIGNLKKLTKLDVQLNQLLELPKEIGELENLNVLILGNNKLSVLPAEIAKLQNLKSLNLSFNLLNILPKEIGELKNLTFLGWSGNQLDNLPKEIAVLKKLTKLDLQQNKLTVLPGEIANLKDLKILNLNQNNIIVFPKEILKLENLTDLYLQDNKMAILPGEIKLLENLTDFTFAENELTNLPEEIGELKNLLFLDLSDNKLTVLPKNIRHLTNLTALTLNGNQLTDLPNGIGQMINLNYLSLNKNYLNLLPEGIVELKNLTSLHLASNQLTSLPKEINQLIKLTYLNLGDNQITSLPIEIGELKKLSLLNLSNNKLTVIPNGISKLQDLLSLDLRGNKLPLTEIEKIQRLLPNCEIKY